MHGVTSLVVGMTSPSPCLSLPSSSLFSAQDVWCTPSVSSLKLMPARIKKAKITQKVISAKCEVALESAATSSSSSEKEGLSSSASSTPSPDLTCERGIVFSTGSSFYREQSSLSRDLAVLAAALYKRSQGQLRVLDAMCGCGVRALRYLTQSQADFVLANDCNPSLHGSIVENLSRYAPNQGLHLQPPKHSDKMAMLKSRSHAHRVVQVSSSNSNPEGFLNETEMAMLKSNSQGHRVIEVSSSNSNPEGFLNETKTFDNGDIPSRECAAHPLEANGSGLPHAQRQAEGSVDVDTSSDIKWQVSHEEATRLLMKCNLDMNFFDFIDVDSFGSDSLHIGSALSALRYGGLLFLTCTDGFSSGGHRPYNALAQYGAFVTKMPYANELGLRMLMGAVVREASLRNMTVSPIFSVYAPHGPVFRVLLRASAGKPSKIMHYRFISYCQKCGNSSTVDWECLGTFTCACSEKGSKSLKISGPLWTGPLHNSKDIQEMVVLAKEWGWISDASVGETKSGYSRGERKKKQEKLWELLNFMLEESHPELPFGFMDLDEVARRAKVSTPGREALIEALKDEGYMVSRSHIYPNALKTNCPMTSFIEIAKRIGAKGS